MGSWAQAYDYVFRELADRRSDETWLVASPWPCLVISAAYLAFVLLLGPRLMRSRRPLHLNRPIAAYNGLQVAANAYLVYLTLNLFTDEQHGFWCQPLLYHRKDQFGMSTWRTFYYFYLLKILDLMDTVFFVLRKKDGQVTFLHVYHHCSMVILLWIATRYFPGGVLVAGASLNALVHSVMYSYYLLATLRAPGLAAWKHRVTQLQLMQFVLNLVNITRDILSPCEGPVVFPLIVLGQNVLFLWLFLRFYRRSYAAEAANGSAPPPGHTDGRKLQ